jgi:hypothetical protein
MNDRILAHNRKYRPDPHGFTRAVALPSLPPELSLPKWIDMKEQARGLLHEPLARRASRRCTA